MIDVDVKAKLLEFAKEHTTFTGGWDYGNAIRELLWIKDVFYNLNIRIDKLEHKVDGFSLEVKEQQAPKIEEKNDNPDGLLGRHHVKKVEDKEEN